MMLAGQPAATLDLAEHTADDCAQGLLHDLVVGNQAVWHATFGHATVPERGRRKGQAPVA